MSSQFMAYIIIYYTILSFLAHCAAEFLNGIHIWRKQRSKSQNPLLTKNDLLWQAVFVEETAAAASSLSFWGTFILHFRRLRHFSKCHPQLVFLFILAKALMDNTLLWILPKKLTYWFVNPLPRNKRFLLKFLSRQNASKFAIFFR